MYGDSKYSVCVCVHEWLICIRAGGVSECEGVLEGWSFMLCQYLRRLSADSDPPGDVVRSQQMRR